MLELEQYIRLNYGEDEDQDDRNEEDVADPLFMSGGDLLDRMKEMTDIKGMDLSIYKAILRVLRFMPDVDIKRVLEEQSELLYYIPREFCLLLRACLSRDQADVDFAKVKLLSTISMSPFADLVYVRSWVLDLFARGSIPCTIQDFANYDFSRSINEKRYELLLHGIWDDKAYFRNRRARFSEFSDWEKPAALMGALCLPADEYKTWVGAITDENPGPFPKIFASWLKESHGRLSDVLTAEA